MGTIIFFITVNHNGKTGDRLVAIPEAVEKFFAAATSVDFSWLTYHRQKSFSRFCFILL